MIQLKNINVSFGANPLLKNLDIIINKGDKVALTGKNGAGKSTLMQIIANIMTPTSGSIVTPKDIAVAYLPQQMQVTDSTTLFEETKSALSDSGHLYENEGGINADVARMLVGLGFLQSDFKRPTSEFSGGWRMRIELAKILLGNPDVLLLDEPTNHLDIESIGWLENFLRLKNKTLVVVSHDKAFLDNVTNRTIEINCGHIYDYKVNYSQFVKLRQERLDQQLRAYANQQKEIAEIKSFIEKFRYKATKAVQVQSRIKQLEKIVPIEIDEVDNSEISLKFPSAPRSGDFPVVAENVEKSYGDFTVIKDVEFRVRRGEKIAFVGRNGEGKSTLVKCITGEIPFGGSLKIGHNVQIGYFSQNEAQKLNPGYTVFETVDRVATGEIRTRLKDILGAFKFRGDEIEKKVNVLSGGEKTRLAMIKLLLQPANLLIMDEPTNHLDIPTKEILKQALLDYNGTLIIVSHDRDFLNGLVNKVFEFGNRQVNEYLGGIDDFLFSKGLQEIKEIEIGCKPDKPHIACNGDKSTVSDTKKEYLRQKEIGKERKRLERLVEKSLLEVEKIESQLKEIENKIAEGDSSPETLARYDEVSRSLEQAMEKWEEHQYELEKMK